MFTLSAQSNEASYKITFTSNWSQNTHPHSSGNIPSNAHWSKLVGATHNSGIVFLMMGSVASNGVEGIAELGANGVFFDEVNYAIERDRADQIINGGSLGSAQGKIIIDETNVSSDYPLLSLVCMIAPSPDWMIAINSISLLDQDENWIEHITVDMYPYDSGTDSGLDYNSPNNDTDPPEPIMSLQGIIPFSNEKIGTIEIELLDTNVGVDDMDEQSTIQVYPNPTQGFLTIASSDLPIKKISVFNYTGALIRELNNLETKSHQFDISSLSSGIYFMRIEDGNSISNVSKIIKQ